MRGRRAVDWWRGSQGCFWFVGGGVSALVAEEVTAVLEVVNVGVGCSRVVHFAGVWVDEVQHLPPTNPLAPANSKGVVSTVRNAYTAIDVICSTL